MSRYQHALLGGLFIGVVSALPVVGALNACCCLWVVTGGLLSTYVLQQNRPDPVDSGEAAVGGALSGLLGAFLHMALAALLLTVANESVESQLRAALDENSQISPEMREWLASILTGRNLMLLVSLFSLVMYPIVSTLGALLGLAFFRKKTPPVSP